MENYKFSTLEYKRPDLEVLRAQLAQWKDAVEHAESYDALRALLFEMDRAACELFTQYARDISQKVKSALHAKQQRGEFIGAFASYGYCKDPRNRNRLVIDPPAAEVVRRIFTLFENGMGKLRIAR